MGKRIIAFAMAVGLIIALPVFSFSAGSYADSGSARAVSSWAVRSSDVVALAAAADSSVGYGYNIEPYVTPVEYYGLNTSKVQYLAYLYLPAGQYVFDVAASSNFRAVGVYDPSSGSVLGQVTGLSSNTSKFVVNVSSYGRFELYFYAPSGGVHPDNFSLLDVNITSVAPVQGISSGFTYSSGTISGERRSDFGTMDFSFGSQPAGKYLINIYHWGDSYDVTFDVSSLQPEAGDFNYPVIHSDGVAVFVCDHPGGDMSFDGSFSIVNTDSSYVDGWYEAFGGVAQDGEITFEGASSWTFNITDIIAVPYDSAGDHNFGFFSPLISYLRDSFASLTSSISVLFGNLQSHLTTQFTQLKTNITNQFTSLKTALSTHFSSLFDEMSEHFTYLHSRLSSHFYNLNNNLDAEFTSLRTLITDLFASDEAEADVDQAADSLQKEVEELGGLSTELSGNTATLEQQFTTDFAIPDDLTGNASNIQLIYTGLFSALGMFSIYIWLPVLFAVIRKLLRL